MKKISIVFILLISIVTLTGCDNLQLDQIETQIESYEDNDILTSMTDNEVLNNTTTIDWGSYGALNSIELSIEEMLIYAIEDEFTARSEYEYIMTTFDVEKPFSNIIESEETHINLLLPLFDTYQYIVPDDQSEEHLFEIESLKEAFEIGVIAEINNIDMYNLFLTYELPNDIEDVFIKLRDASINHLDAFQKNLDKLS